MEALLDGEPACRLSNRNLAVIRLPGVSYQIDRDQPLISRPRRRIYVGQFGRDFIAQALKRRSDRTVPRPVVKLDKQRLRVAPHDEQEGRVHRRMEGDHLLVILTVCTVIEANHHSQAAKVSPTLHENKVSDLERETFRSIDRRGGNAALRQRRIIVGHSS